MTEIRFRKWHTNRALVAYVQRQAHRYFPRNPQDSEDAAAEAWARISFAPSATSILELRKEAARAINAFYHRMRTRLKNDRAAFQQYRETKMKGCRQTRMPPADR